MIEKCNPYLITQSNGRLVNPLPMEGAKMY